jgi:hypothetical protein
VEIFLLLAVLTCAAFIVAGLLVPTLRPLAVSGAAALLFLVCSFVWWSLLYAGVGPDLPRGLLGAILFFMPPLLPTALLVYFLRHRGGAV